MAEDLAPRHGDYGNEDKKALVDLMTHLLTKDRDLLIKLLDTREGIELLRAKLTGRDRSPTRLA
jgi:hypothetical protein